MIINDFIKNLNNNPQKVAFVYCSKGHIHYKSYQDVYADMFKVINYLESKGFKIGTKILLFLKPSYDFYILMLAALYMSYQVIVIDSFKDKEKVKHMIALSSPDFIVANKVTKLIKPFLKPLKHLKTLDITKYKLYVSTYKEPTVSQKDVLITFTSGSTGMPKKISRTISDLERQFNLVENTIEVTDDCLILALIPIYVLVNLIFGATNLLYSKSLKGRNIKKIEKLLTVTKTNSISASVSKYLCFKRAMPFITRCYTGGSLISLSDARKIKDTFPNAFFTYVYGASEAVLMSKTTIEEYIRNLEEGNICIGEVVDDIIISFKDVDKNGIGEICVAGEAVLTDDKHPTGDLGYIKNNKLYLVGRKKMSLVTDKKNYYNYLIEMSILRDMPQVKKCVFLPLSKRRILVLEVKHKRNIKTDIDIFKEYEIIIVKKLPVDIRHNYKIDYEKVLSLINVN